MFFRTLLFTLLLTGVAFAEPYFCATLQVFSNDKTVCETVCRAACEKYVSDKRSFAPCDTQNYHGFVYSDIFNRTYAISKTKLAAPKSNLGVINSLAAWLAVGSVAGYLNADIMMGLKEKTKQGGFVHDFNKVDKERFGLPNGNSLSFKNFAADEPNNAYPGESYVIMDRDGVWYDVAFKPNIYYELAEWNGPLSCVAGIAPPDPVFMDDIRNRICTPSETSCIACFPNSSGSGENDAHIDDVRRCIEGALYHQVGRENLCPEGRMKCAIAGASCADLGAVEAEVETLHYCVREPQLSCPEGGFYRESENRCIVYTDRCADGFVWNDTAKECEIPIVCNQDMNAAMANYDRWLDQCVARDVVRCPDGYTMIGNTCEKDVTCPHNYVWDSAYQQCRSITTVCPTGTTFANIDGAGMCQTAPICPSGATLNGNVCVRNPTAFLCSEGGSFSTVQQCFTGCTTTTTFPDWVGGTTRTDYRITTTVIAHADGSFFVTHSCARRGSNNVGNRCSGISFSWQISAGGVIGGPTSVNSHVCISYEQVCGIDSDGYYSCWMGDSYNGATCAQYYQLWVDQVSIQNGTLSFRLRTQDNRDTHNASYSVPASSRPTCTASCPGGTTWNSTMQRCESHPTCNSGYTYNNANQQCERPAYYEQGCNLDTVSSDGRYCVLTPNPCVYGNINTTTGKCTLTLAITKPCEAGYIYNFDQKTCTKTICQPIHASPNFDGTVCQANRKITCPTGYTPFEGECKRLPDASCFTDFVPDTDTDYGVALKTINGLCMRTDDRRTICPYGDNYKCIQPEGEEDFYCSNNTCFNLDDMQEQDESSEGENDPKNDGDPNLCAPLLFQGVDSRCRPPGLQTAYVGCCTSKSAETWHLEIANQGKPQEPLIDIYTKASEIGKGNLMQDVLTVTSMATAIFSVQTEMLTTLMPSICKSNEVRVAVKVSGNPSSCQYIGEYCSWRVSYGFGSKCMQKKKTYCCFSNIFEKVIAIAARNTNPGFGWGTPGKPNCRGMTMEEFAKIDWQDPEAKRAMEELVRFFNKELAGVLDDKTISDMTDQMKDMILRTTGN